MVKKIGDISTIKGQAQRFAKYANSDNVTTNVFKDAVDKAKTFIPGLNYNKDEIENESMRRDFLNFSSTILKLKSGLTVSDKEAKRFEQSLGTLSKNKESNFIGIRQQLLDIRNNINGTKRIAPEYFNLKYGSNIRALDKSINQINHAIGDKNTNINKEGKNNKLRSLSKGKSTPTTTIINSSEALNNWLK